MADYINASQGSLVLPGGVEIAPGATADVAEELASNPAVAEWISAGRLVTPDKWAPVASETIDSLKAQIADQAAQIAALQADLAAATAPKK